MSREKANAKPPRIMVLIDPPMALADQQTYQRRKRNGKYHREGRARAAEKDENH